MEEENKNVGAIDVIIDNITPCLKDNTTGDIIETEVLRVKRKSFLTKFNKKNGWYTNWGLNAPSLPLYDIRRRNEETNRYIRL